MANVRHKAKTRRTGSKTPVVKTAKAKATRVAPKETKRAAPKETKRKRVVSKEIRPEAPVALIAQAPIRATAGREAQGFPFFWPPFAMMRMWLGPRHPR